MRRYVKLNLNDSYFWQSTMEDGMCTYTKKRYESKDNILDAVFFEELPNGILMELVTRNILIINNNDGFHVEYPKGIEFPSSNLKEVNSLELKSKLNKIKNLNLENDYKTLCDELLLKSHQCELVCAIKENKLELNLKK